MIPINLSGKTALVTGVADTVGFGWHIAKVLQAAGAQVALAVHPRVLNIVEKTLGRSANDEDRKLPFGVAGEFSPSKVYPSDLQYDTLADVPDEQYEVKGYSKEADFTVAGLAESLKADFGSVDYIIHSVAFSREIKNPLIDTSRRAYLEALSISAYSLTALCHYCLPLMEGREGAVVGLTYIGGDRAVPYYGGGMSSAKAALQIDAKQLSYFLGQKGHRVNLVSPGPYASRAARGIGDIGQMIDHAVAKSPLPRPIEAEEVANTVLFLLSPLSSAITGEVIYVDCGYHAMGN
jgi:enoyl-[acyl-carrier protein] reductase I